MSNKTRLPWHVKWKYVWIGAISGFVAVNLLNPFSNLTEIIPLAIIAGLSPISYLRGQTITDGSSEEASLKSYGQAFKDTIEILEDEDEIVTQLKKEYNITKGDGVDEEQ